MDSKFRKWILWFFLAWNALLFYLLFTPGSLYHNIHFFKGEDKVAHIVLFAVWALSCSLIFSRHLPQRRITVLSLGLALVLAALTEFIQLFVPNRTAGIPDFMADAIGAVLGILIVNLLKKELNRARKKLDN